MAEQWPLVGVEHEFPRTYFSAPDFLPSSPKKEITPADVWQCHREVFAPLREFISPIQKKELAQRRKDAKENQRDKGQYYLISFFAGLARKLIPTADG